MTRLHVRILYQLIIFKHICIFSSKNILKMDHVRPDLRATAQLRPVNTELSIVNEADASCSLTVGNTFIISSLYGPKAPKYSRHEQFDRASVEVEINFVNKENATSSTNITAGSVESGQNHHQERELARHIRSVTESVLQLHEYPRTLILIRLNIVRNDGSLLSVALNVCGLLLSVSGLKMNAMPITVALATIQNKRTAESVDVVDPSISEEADAAATATVTLAYRDGMSTGVLLTEATGTLLSVAKTRDYMDLAEVACDSMHVQLKSAL
jgi:exosome complex component RRP46